MNGANVTLVDRAEDAGPRWSWMRRWGSGTWLGLRGPARTVTAQVESGEPGGASRGAFSPTRALSVDLALTIEGSPGGGAVAHAARGVAAPRKARPVPRTGKLEPARGGGDALAVVVEDRTFASATPSAPARRVALRLAVPGWTSRVESWTWRTSRSRTSRSSSCG